MEGTIEQYDETTNIALIWVDFKKIPEGSSIVADMRAHAIRQEKEGALIRAVLTNKEKWQNAKYFDKPLPGYYIGFNCGNAEKDFGYYNIEVCVITTKVSHLRLELQSFFELEELFEPVDIGETSSVAKDIIKQINNDNKIRIKSYTVELAPMGEYDGNVTGFGIINITFLEEQLLSVIKPFIEKMITSYCSEDYIKGYSYHINYEFEEKTTLKEAKVETTLRCPIPMAEEEIRKYFPAGIRRVYNYDNETEYKQLVQTFLDFVGADCWGLTVDGEIIFNNYNSFRSYNDKLLERIKRNEIIKNPGSLFTDIYNKGKDTKIQIFMFQCNSYMLLMDYKATEKTYSCSMFNAEDYKPM